MEVNVSTNVVLPVKTRAVKGVLDSVVVARMVFMASTVKRIALDIA